MTTVPQSLNAQWDARERRDEQSLIAELSEATALDCEARAQIKDHAQRLVKDIRASGRTGLMDAFLAEYGLSTDEGIALMCLAEALLRVPDAATLDALIDDKITGSNWSRHIGQAASPLINASTWGLLIAGKVLQEGGAGLGGQIHALVQRLGEPLVRVAIAKAIQEMGRQFVLGETIDAAMQRAAQKQRKIRKHPGGRYTYSYDMLGEAAVTQDDAAAYLRAYEDAIDAIADGCTAPAVADNPGISVKLSALHPRYEAAKADRVVAELVPPLLSLARRAKDAQMGLNIDAEEADKAALSLSVIERVLRDPSLAGWEGFGIVVQAYTRRAMGLIDQLYKMATRLDRRIMVRLVKGAYWDAEIKQAQTDGLADFPVFTRKAATDVSYLACARRLFRCADRIYPQFATHNAHTVAAMLAMAAEAGNPAFEFQRLHGMGEALYEKIMREQALRCRVYAPVGIHKDLLAYLVRRLLENGANSSFVHRLSDRTIPATAVIECPFESLAQPLRPEEPNVVAAADLFAPERSNSAGFDLSDTTELARIDAARQPPAPLVVGPIMATSAKGGAEMPIHNPATGARIGRVVTASAADVTAALAHAAEWDAPAAARQRILQRAADLFEEDFGDAFALLAVEAGKTLPDAVAELREAVDFLRFYAAGIPRLQGPPRGLVVCISPWNFPLAIFTGQVAAALAAGNAVLAKPAEATPAIAQWAVEHLHQAGIPKEALQLLPGEGGSVGRALTTDPRVGAVAFTGSTTTARQIQRALAEKGTPGTPLVAETGGLNAMIVDSTALPEQVVRDVTASAFQSAGQRCSALRCLYVQEDIAARITDMLIGAVNELALGDPWKLATDLGPVISSQAQRDINDYVAAAAAEGRLIHRVAAPERGFFVAPALISISSIRELPREVFGPVLHIATFTAGAMDQVINDINQTGYGLTFGLHSRINDRVQHVVDRVAAGNIYVNRNQIGAIVGSQPFGGEGLSGTGPKAGGPHYVTRFTRKPVPAVVTEPLDPAHRLSGDQPGDHAAPTPEIDGAALAQLLQTAMQTAPETASSHDHTLPGPTGELNRLSLRPRAPWVCLGPGNAAAQAQKEAVIAHGGRAVIVDGRLDPDILISTADMPDIGGVLWWGDDEMARAYACALAKRPAPIVPLLRELPDRAHASLERHLCVDTAAAGGNADLLAGRTPA